MTEQEKRERRIEERNARVKKVRRNRLILAAIAVVVVIIIIACVSCGKKDDNKQETKATIDNLIRDTLWAGLLECYDDISVSRYRQQI